MKDNVYKISILGPQGSGKGTQAELLAKRLQIPALSMGQLLRDEVNKESVIGKEIKAILEAGGLVSHKITDKLFQERIMQSDAQNGFIIDGYPRNDAQYQFVKGIDAFNYVIALHLSDEKAIERIGGRRICSCGGLYHVIYNPPKQTDICDACGSKLIIRSDDTPEAIKERLRIYHEESKSVIEKFRQNGIVHDIDGDQSIEDVNQAICNALDI